MKDGVILLGGVVLGGLASWIITDIYYRKTDTPRDSVFGYRKCPKCGESGLKNWTEPDERDEGISHYAGCSECGWKRYMSRSGFDKRP